MPQIFLNYRRSDTGSDTHRLYDRLTQHYRSEQIFMDTTNIESGTKFPNEIDKALKSCEVLIVMIGNQWLNISMRGKRRLDDPEDFVRKEIEVTLKRKIPIIPVLVGHENMPLREELPNVLGGLADWEAFHLSNYYYDEGIKRLINQLDKILAPSYGIKLESPQDTHTQQSTIIKIEGSYKQRPPDKSLHLFVEVNGKVWPHFIITQFDEINKRWYGQVTAVENQPGEEEYDLLVKAVLVGKNFSTRLDNRRELADAKGKSDPLDSMPNDVTICDQVKIVKKARDNSPR